MKIYAESSAVLAWLLGEDAAPRVRDVLGRAELVMASDLTVLECDRVLIRAVALGEIGEAAAADRRSHLNHAAAHWHVLRLTTDIVDRARQPFPAEPILILDALHLASALAARSSVAGVELLSLDDRVRRVGASWGSGFNRREFCRGESSVMRQASARAVAVFGMILLALTDVGATCGGGGGGGTGGMSGAGEEVYPVPWKMAKAGDTLVPGSLIEKLPSWCSPRRMARWWAERGTKTDSCAWHSSRNWVLRWRARGQTWRRSSTASEAQRLNGRSVKDSRRRTRPSTPTQSGCIERRRDSIPPTPRRCGIALALDPNDPYNVIFSAEVLSSLPVTSGEPVPE